MIPDSANCKAAWSSHFDSADGFPADKATRITDTIYRGGIAAIKAKLGG